MASSSHLPHQEGSDKTPGPDWSDDDWEDYDDAYETVATESPRGCCARVCATDICGEFKELVSLAVPMLGAQALEMAIGPVSLIFCGHLGEVELDAVALANSLIQLTGVYVATGLSTACDALFSQAYGSINRRISGMYLQRSLIILILSVFPCWAVQLNIEALLRLTVTDPQVARLAGNYMIIFMPATLAIFIHICLAKYIQSQGCVIPGVVIGIVGNTVNALLHHVFLHRDNMGTQGSAIAQTVTYVMMLIMTLMYLSCSRIYRETWAGWCSDCFQEWGQFMSFALPGLLMIALEMGALQIGLYLSGLLGNTPLGAQSVLIQLEGIFTQVPLAIGGAVAIRVGQYLGSSNGQGAKTVSWMGLVIVLIMAILTAFILYSTKDVIPRMFTQHQKIVELAETCIPALVTYIVFFSISTVCCGVVRGSGRQKLRALVIVLTTVVVALSLGLPALLASSAGINGYWWAFALAFLLNCIIMLTVVFTTNWRDQVALAQDRVGNWIYTGLLWRRDHTKDAAAKPQEKPTERTRLIGSRQIRRGTVYQPVDPILCAVDPRMRRFSWFPELTAAEQDAIISGTSGQLPFRTLLLRRSLALLAVLYIFGVGVYLKLNIVFPTETCNNCTQATTNRYNFTST